MSRASLILRDGITYCGVCNNPIDSPGHTTRKGYCKASPGQFARQGIPGGPHKHQTPWRLAERGRGSYWSEQFERLLTETPGAYQRLLSHLAMYSERHAEVFIRVAVQNQKVKDVAEDMELTRDNVRKIRNRISASLKEYMKD